MSHTKNQRMGSQGLYLNFEKMRLSGGIPSSTVHGQEIHIQASLRCHITTIKLANLKRAGTPISGMLVKKRVFSYSTKHEPSHCKHLLKVLIPFNLVFPLLRTYVIEIKYSILKGHFQRIFTVVLFILDKMGNT